MSRVQKSASTRKPRTALEPKPRACRECNGHKIFCSKERPKCERCRLRSLPCVYAGPTLIQVREDTLKSLKRKLRGYQEMIAALPPDVRRLLPTKPAVVSNSSGDDDDDSEADETGDPTDDVKHMGLENQQSSDSFIRIVTKMTGLPGADGDDGEGSLPGPSALPSRRLEGRAAALSQPLPPIDIARQYFSAQHMYIGTIFAFSDPADFDRQLKEAYAQGPPSPHNDAGCLAHAKLLMILAFGRLYAVNRRADDADTPPGFLLFSQGMALLPDLHDKGSILGVETLAYAGYFLQNMNCRDAAYLYIGLGLRMAITLGLHRELGEDEAADDTTREHRRRVWWSIYSLDRILSLKSGYPTSILDGDIGVRMPARLPGEPVESPVEVLRCYTEMSRILGEIIALVYRAPSRSPPTTSVHAILHSLDTWEAALPPHLRLDAGLSRESISVHLHCYQCVSMTARPLLFQVAQRRLTLIRRAMEDSGREAARAAQAVPWQTGLARKTVAVVDRCMAAARQTVRIMAQAAAHDLVATFGYMDGEYALSAAMVLTLVCGAFPASADDRAVMAQGLALLRRIGDLGNRYVAARYGMLARLQARLASQAGEEVTEPEPEPDSAPEPEVVPDIAPLEPWPFAVDTIPMMDDADSSLWTAAFANTAGLEFFQFLPETEPDMTDYLGL